MKGFEFMKTRYVDGIVLETESVELESNVLKITHKGMTAEELQAFYTQREKLQTIELLTPSDDVYGIRAGFVCYAGLNMFGEDITVSLVQEADKDSVRITKALADALAALTQATEANGTATMALQGTDLNTQEVNTLAAEVDYIAMMTGIE